MSSVSIDPRTFQAILGFTIRPDLKLPTDTSAVVSTGGLLGGQFITLSPGGAVEDLKDNGTIKLTQSATNLEDLLGKFIFNVGSLADATQKSLQAEEPPVPMSWPGADGTPISCREKIRTLDANEAEARQVLQDTFEDAILMGVDEDAMRLRIATMVASLRSPKLAK